MSKTAFLFPGQGSQFVGMGQDLYEQVPAARARFDAADDLLGYALTDVMFGRNAEDDAAAEEALKQTDVTQPALYVHSLAVMAVLADAGHAPDMAAGHSLGEYSALAAVGALSFEDGLRVVRRRGELMAEAGEHRPGAMAAVLGVDDDTIESVCRDVSENGKGVVQPANFNAPGQIVISGDVEAVEQAMDDLPGRTIRLPVSGAFHSPLMAYAENGLAEVLDTIDIQPPQCPVYLNVTAQPTTDPDEIRTQLLAQLRAPVRWAQTLHAMHEAGAGRFVEVGAGKVLRGLVRRTIGRDAETQGAGTADDVAVLAEE
jgi:[acyl-carrier-protein] S-malonyltransferase